MTTDGCASAKLRGAEMMSNTRMPRASCSAPVITRLPPAASIVLIAPPNAHAIATSPFSKAATAAGPPSEGMRLTSSSDTPRCSSILSSLKCVTLPIGV